MLTAPTAPHPLPAPDQPARVRRPDRFGLLGVVVGLALAVRLWGLSWQLPNAIYHDEMKYVLAATNGPPSPEDEPTDFRNPSLFRHLLELEYLPLPPLNRTLPGGGIAADSGSLAARILLARLTVALFGVGSVALLYLVGCRAFGPRTGLLAAALLGVNFLHFQLSHVGLNDVPACFFLIAALLPSLRLLRPAHGRDFLLAGLFGGLAAATKYNFGIVLAAPLAAWGIQVWAVHRGARRELLLLGPLLVGLGALVGFIVGMPEIFGSLAAIRDGVLEQSQTGDRRWPGQAPDPTLLLYGQTLVQSFGWPALAAALAGLVLALRRRPLLSLVLLPAPLAYLAFMSSKLLFFGRFALPLLPFVCLLAAYALARLWSKLGASSLRVTLVALTCLVVLGPPLLPAIRLDLLTGQTDTRVLALEWVRNNLPSGSGLAVQTYALPVSTANDEAERLYRIAHFGSIADPRRFTQLACAGNRYFLVSSFRTDREQTVGRPGEPTGYELLASRGQLLQTFWPGPNGTSVPFNNDDLALPFWQLAGYERPGPTIRIYGLPEPVVNCQ